MSCFANVEFCAFTITNYLYDAIGLTVEMLGNIHGAFRSFDIDRDTDEGTRFTLIMVARRDS